MNGSVELIKQIVEYGFMTVFAGVTLYFLVKFVELQLKKVKGSFAREQVINPGQHYFFTKIEYILMYQLPRIDLMHKGKIDKNRTKLFRDLLRIKFEYWHTMMAVISTENYEKMSTEEMDLDIRRRIYKLITDYESTWRSMQVPEILIKKFNGWHSIRAQLFLDAVENICMGRSFDTRKEMILAIMEISVALLVYTILDAEKSLGELDGDLDGLKYGEYIL